jgi:hypothetical protein
MKLRVTFVGVDPIPLKIVSEVMLELDKKLAQLEARKISNLYKEFPELSKEDAKRTATEFRLAYRNKAFSMIQVETIDRGCLIVFGVMTAAALWFLKNTLGESFKAGYKGSLPDKHFTDAFRKKIDYYFLTTQKNTLVQAAYKLLNKYNREHSKISEIRQVAYLPDSTQQITSMSPLTLRDSVSDIVALPEPLPKTFTEESVETLQAKIEKQYIRDFGAPNDGSHIIIESIKPHEPENGPHVLNIRVNISPEIKVVTYAEAVDKFNKGESITD